MKINRIALAVLMLFLSITCLFAEGAVVLAYYKQIMMPGFKLTMSSAIFTAMILQVLIYSAPPSKDNSLLDLTALAKAIVCGLIWLLIPVLI